MIQAPDTPRAMLLRWWTYAGTRGQDVHLIAHETHEAALWHHGLAQALGGDFNVLGISRKRLIEAQVRDALAGRFRAIHLVELPLVSIGPFDLNDPNNRETIL